MAPKITPEERENAIMNATALVERIREHDADIRSRSVDYLTRIESGLCAEAASFICFLLDELRRVKQEALAQGWNEGWVAGADDVKSGRVYEKEPGTLYGGRTTNPHSSHA